MSPSSKPVISKLAIRNIKMVLNATGNATA